MLAVRLLARKLRRWHVTSMLLVAVVVGLSGGLVTGLVAGSGRTSSALDRFVERAKLLDVFIGAPAGSAVPAQVDKIRELPGVEGAALIAVPSMRFRGHDLSPPMLNVDGRYGVEVDVARIVRGRAADPESASEIVVSETWARHLGVDVGDSMHFDSLSPAQLRAGQDEGPPFNGPSPVVRIVGVSRLPQDLLGDNPDNFFIHLPRGFWERYGTSIGEWGRLIAIDVGKSPSQSEVRTVTNAARDVVGPKARVEETGEQLGAHLFRTLNLVAEAMIVLAGAVGLAGAAVGAFGTWRMARRAAGETLQLTSLGMTSRQRAGAVLLGLFPSAVAAGVIALGVAGLSSIFLPFGLARTAEPDPGFALDAAVITIGVVVTIVIALLALVAFAVHATHSSRPRGTVRRAPRRSWRHRIDLPVASLVGLDLAFGHTARRDRGVYTAIAGVALASSAACGSLVLADSVNHLLTTPAVYGWTWDLVVPEGDPRLLAKDVDVAAASEVRAATLLVEGRPIIARGIRTMTGPTPLQVTHGLPPGSGEIVLGARTMADLDADIGDIVTVSGDEQDQDMRIVGEAVFAGVIDVPYAGLGAALTLEDLVTLDPADSLSEAVVLSLADGVDPEEFADRITSITGISPEAARQPAESIRVRQIQALPWVLTAFLTTVGLVAVMHALLVTASQSKMDLAVLSALGMLSRGIRQSFAVTASSIALLGAVVGVPFGIAGGTALWRNLASSLGVIVSVQTPWFLLALATVGSAALLAAVALLPVRRAWRTPPTDALHSE